MLLVFVLFFFFKTNDTHAAPISSYPSDLSIFTCDDLSAGFRGRTVMDIIWSCLATTFACTWVCLHPNLPFRNEGSWTILRRRIFLMLFSIIAPEFMVIWAFKQWRGARMIKDAVNEAFPNSPPWTTTHGHFLQMGGFKVAITLQERNQTSVLIEHMSGDEVLEGVLSFNSFRQLITENFIALPNVTEDEINDKSKGDAISKGFALMQLTWFIAQIIARTVQGLAITELELTTAALAGLNSAMYLFWWSKPRDVRFPMIIRTKGVEQLLLATELEVMSTTFPEPEDFCFRKHLWTSITKSIARTFVTLGTFLLSSPGRTLCASLVLIIKIKSMIIGFSRLISSLQFAFSTGNQDKVTNGKPISSIQFKVFSSLPSKDDETVLDTMSQNVIAKSAICVMKYAVVPFALLAPIIDAVLIIPIAKILDRNSERSLAGAFGFNMNVVQDTFSMIFFSEDADVKTLFSFSSIAGGLFGAVHLLAWSSSVPSRLEQLLWRAASLGVVGSCILLFAATCVVGFLGYTEERASRVRITFGVLLVGLGTLLPVLSIPVPIVYPTARLALLVLASMSLRSLPDSAFQTVSWIEFLPHV